MYTTYTCPIVCPYLLIQSYYIIKRKEKEKENRYRLRNGRQFMTKGGLGHLLGLGAELLTMCFQSKLPTVWSVENELAQGQHEI